MDILMTEKEINKLSDIELTEGIMLMYLCNYDEEPWENMTYEEQFKAIMKWSKDNKVWEYNEELRDMCSDE